MNTTRWRRRARPLLGTLVEVGVASGAPDAAIEAAFAAVADVQRRMSRFDPASDIGRFNAASAGAVLEVDADTATVLAAAAQLHTQSGGLFDISLGRYRGWQLDGRRLVKREAGTQLDLGGIAKGHAVDRAVAALREAGLAAGWVNAGGDLRAFGNVSVPIVLRDEHRGGARRFAALGDGAFATSDYRAAARARLHVAGPAAPAAHVSVAAPACLWADALTKVVALTRDPAHPLLAAHNAVAWLH